MTKARDLASNSTGSKPTLVDAKGDLLVGTAADTAGRLVVGSSGDTLVADSSTSTGLRWNPSYQAGKNFIINGGFDIWQRGTSFSTTNGGNGYHADRWTYFGGNTGTLSQSTALLRDGAQFALRFTSTSANGVATPFQMIETVNTVPLQGQTVTLSVYVAGTAGKTASVELRSSTVDNDGIFGTYTNLTASGTSSVTTTGSYQRITAQFTVPTDARTLRVGLPCPALNSTEFISWAQVQLEVGSTATAFSRAGGTLAGELVAAQRYYQKSYPIGTAPGASFPGGYSVAVIENNIPNGNYYHYQPLINQMRGAPTVTIYSGSGATGRMSTTGGGDLAASSAVAALITDNHFTIQNSSGGALTASAGGFIFFYVASAEL